MFDDEIATLPSTAFGLGPVLDGHRLSELFAVRPDLADPPPEGLSELEARLGSLSSLQHCLQRLDRFSCQVAQTLALTGPEPSLPEVVELIGPDARPVEVKRVLEDLRARGLIERWGEAIRIHPAIRRQPSPAGLGPQATELLSLRSSEQLRAIAFNVGVPAGSAQQARAHLVARVAKRLTDPERLRTLMSTSPRDAFALAMRLALGTPTISTSVGFWPVYSRTAPECSWRVPHLWLARNGFVIEQEWYAAVMPREVAMVLRGGRPFEIVTAVRPPLFPMAVDSSKVESSATSRATSLVRAVEELIEQWGSSPARLLKKGAVASRDLQRFAKATELDAADAAVVVELAVLAGLVGADFTTWTAVPLEACDSWLSLELEKRWEVLVRAWLAASSFLGRTAAGPGNQGRQHCTPFDGRTSPVASELRERCLAALLDADPGTGLDDDSLSVRLEWDAPLLWSEAPVAPLTAVGWICRDAELLGILHEGSLSSSGREAAGGDVGRAASLLALELPPAVQSAALQAK